MAAGLFSRKVKGFKDKIGTVGSLVRKVNKACEVNIKYWKKHKTQKKSTGPLNVEKPLLANKYLVYLS
jgi:hypothetical protein